MSAASYCSKSFAQSAKLRTMSAVNRCLSGTCLMPTSDVNDGRSTLEHIKSCVSLWPTVSQKTQNLQKIFWWVFRALCTNFFTRVSKLLCNTLTPILKMCHLNSGASILNSTGVPLHERPPESDSSEDEDSSSDDVRPPSPRETEL